MWIRPRKLRHRGGVRRQNNLERRYATPYMRAGLYNNATMSVLCIHAAELQAVGVCLVMRRQVVVVEYTDLEHGRVNANAQEDDGDETHRLVDMDKKKAVSEGLNVDSFQKR